MQYLTNFLAYAKLQFKTSFVYRLQFMASIIISPLTLVLYYFMWQSVFANTTGDVLGYTFPEMIKYYVISMIIGHFIYNAVGNKMQEKIIYGDLNQDLLKPVSIFMQFLAKELSERGFAFIAEVIPVFVISFVFFKLTLPHITLLLVFALTVFFAFMINFLLSFLIGLLAFWVKNIQSVQWLTFIFIRFLSGEFIPLEFIGYRFLEISKILPFYYLRYGPIQVFLGKFSQAELFTFILIQTAWIISLYLLIRIAWHFSLKKFGAEGG